MFGRALGQTCRYRTFTRTFGSSKTLYNNSSKDLEKLKQNLIRSSIVRNQDSRSGAKLTIDDEKEANLRKIIANSNMAPKPVPLETPEEELSSKTEVIHNNDTPPNQSNSSDESINRRLQSNIKETIKTTGELEELLKLPSNQERERSKLSKRLESYFDSIQDTIFTASRTLNDVTGYTGIEQLKSTIETLEQELKEARDAVKRRKDAYSAAINERSLLQKDINELLTRKHEWSSNDLERFTTLYRNDHVNEQTEVAAQEALDKAEKMVDTVQLELTRLILTRYHEEQIWSDKIRKALTWGTWVLMGINIGLFMVATFFVEPWKRKKLVNAFEIKVQDMLAVHGGGGQQQNGVVRNQEEEDINATAESLPESVREVAQRLQEVKSQLEKVPVVEISMTEPLWDEMKHNYSKVVSGTEYLQMRTIDTVLVMAGCAVLGTGLGVALGYFVGK